MARYFLEVSYKGTAYSGFQTQLNASSIQAEVEKAISILERAPAALTGSSRTDAGVHARQNFFHFDADKPLHPQFLYKLNAILPGDIVGLSVRPVADDAHCRFDAVSREYEYYLYSSKDPFLADRAYFFPYRPDLLLLQQAASMLPAYTDFTSFSKRNTQVKSFLCHISVSEWREENGLLIFRVKGNRFLRGMVRALTATMLKVGRGNLTLDQFRDVIEAKDCTRASFAVPPHGLFLKRVEYPD